ncbi:hypothetical protein V6V89_07955 [Micromonospora sp. CPCC 206061]
MRGDCRRPALGEELPVGHDVRRDVEDHAGDPGADRHRDQRRVQRLPVRGRPAP